MKAVKRWRQALDASWWIPVALTLVAALYVAVGGLAMTEALSVAFGAVFGDLFGQALLIVGLVVVGGFLLGGLVWLALVWLTLKSEGDG